MNPAPNTNSEIANLQKTNIIKYMTLSIEKIKIEAGAG